MGLRRAKSEGWTERPEGGGGLRGAGLRREEQDSEKNGLKKREPDSERASSERAGKRGGFGLRRRGWGAGLREPAGQSVCIQPSSIRCI